MVEGPGCTLNGERIRARVTRGQEVRDMRGTLGAAGGLDALRGSRYSGVDTLGKELFLYFGSRALRVHFGMNGSMRVTSGLADIKHAAVGNKMPTLEIHLTDDIICFYDSTVDMRLTEQCEGRVSSMRSLDVCSSSFSSSRAEEVLRSQGARMLCDLLLDQLLLPGVGNIIKNEALFDSGLHPAVTAQQLSEQQLRHLIKMTRDFTLLFYKCRRSGAALSRHYKVYGRPACGQCSSSITVCRLGDAGRMTYFCSRCQSADPSRVSTSKLPVRNSLIGWVTKAGSREEEWACPRCTLLNPPAAESCDACLAPRPPVPREQGSSSCSSLIKFPCTSFTRPAEELKVNWRSAFGTTTLIYSDLGPPPGHTGGGATAGHPTGGGAIAGGVAPGGARRPAGAGRELPTNKKMRMAAASPSDGGPSGGGPGAAPGGPTAAPSGGTPCCVAHGRPASLRTVRKDGDNKGRRFYSCSLPREPCSFFQWADLNFPECNHGKRCVVRTVLKLGPNNGRSFYVCGSKMGKQCEYFQWVESSTLPGC